MKRKLIWAGGGLLALFIIVGALFYTGVLWFNMPSRDRNPVWGVDVSNWQGDIDWPLLAAQGMDFAFIKATEGSTFTDARFGENWQGALDSGLLVGAYHFLSGSSTGEAQAEHFIATVPRQAGTLPPVIDIEVGLATPGIYDILDDMIAALEAHYGAPPILYVTHSTYEAFVRGRYERCPIWIRDIFKKPALKDGRAWLLWQYSNRGRLAGYAGGERYIDLNVFSGSRADLEAMTLAAASEPDPEPDLYSRQAIMARQEVVAGGFTAAEAFVKAYAAHAYPDAELIEYQWQSGYAAPDAMFTDSALGGGLGNYTLTLRQGAEPVTLPLQVLYFTEQGSLTLSAILAGDTLTNTRPQGYALLRGDVRYAQRMRDFGELALPPGTVTDILPDTDGDSSSLDFLDMGAHGVVLQRDEGIFLAQNGRETVLLETLRNQDDEMDVHYPYFYAKIDDNRFIYGVGGWEWCWGVGIYDISAMETVYDGTDNPEIQWLYPKLLAGDQLWLADGWEQDFLKSLDVSTFDIRTVHLAHEAGKTLWQTCLSPDGSRIAALAENSDGHYTDLRVFDSRDGALLANYPIEPTAGYVERIGFQGQSPYLVFHRYATEESVKYTLPVTALPIPR